MRKGWAIVLILSIANQCHGQIPGATLEEARRIFAESGLPGAAFLTTTQPPSTTILPTYSPPNYAKHETPRGEEVDRDRILGAFIDPLARIVIPVENPAENTAQVASLVNSVPQLVKIVPNVRPKNISPDLLRHIMNGGQIPGVPPATLKTLVTKQMKAMAEVAARINSGQVVAEEKLVMPPIEYLPPKLVQASLAGEAISGLTIEETQEISTYYLSKLTRLTTMAPPPDATTTQPPPGVIAGLSTEDLLARLPPGFDLTRVPRDMITEITSGKPFDIRQLPDDLLAMFKEYNVDLAEEIDRALNRGGGEKKEVTKQAEENTTEKAVVEDAPARHTSSPNEWILASKLGETPEHLANDKLLAEVDARKWKIFRWFSIFVACMSVFSAIFITFMCVRNGDKLARRRRNRVHGGGIGKLALPSPLLFPPGGPATSSWSLDLSAIAADDRPARTTSTPHYAVKRLDSNSVYATPSAPLSKIPKLKVNHHH